MKILALADLHINLLHNEEDSFDFFLQKKQIQEIINTHNPDCIAIAGDIVEKFVYLFNKKNCYVNLYKFINDFFSDKDQIVTIPIIFCLGNHEFAFNSVKDCINAFSYAQEQNKDKYNIHCLDIIGNFEFKDINFVGNVLWYDGTCSNRADAKLHVEKINEGWLDASISNFDAFLENKKCINQIKNGIKKDKKNVLITHTVPLYDLNAHNIINPNSIWNVYSGHGNLFLDYNIKDIDVSICGHTHLPAKIILDDNNKKIECINIGNDYFMYTKKVIFNIIEI